MQDKADDPVARHILEPRRAPPLDWLLGGGAMLPFAIGAAAAWVLSGPAAALARDLTVIWGGAVLAFLAGVERGLSFRTEGGPGRLQIAMTLGLFALGFAALVLRPGIGALLLLIAGYAILGLLDPIAARRGEAPLYFARLRPLQMLIPLVSLAALLVRSFGPG